MCQLLLLPNLANLGKIFFWHYSIKIIGNFLICFLLLNWFFSIKFIRSFSNRKMSIINRKNSIKFQNIWQNSICYKALCCQKVKVQNWSSWFSNKELPYWSRWWRSQTSWRRRPGSLTSSSKRISQVWNWKVRQVPFQVAPMHNVYLVKYDVTVSFLAQVLDTVTYLVSQVLDTAS